MNKLIGFISASCILLASQLSWGQACGNITSVGCCSGTTVKYCSSGVLKTKSCVGSSYGALCGWVASQSFYSCSPTAGSDPSGKYSRDCDKLPDGGVKPADGGGTAKDSGPVVPCGSIGVKGCCLGNLVKYCSSGSLKTKTCSGSTPQCGWDTTKSFYTCGTSGLADPAGKYPKACGSSPGGDSGAQLDKGGLVQPDRGGSSQPDQGGSGTPDAAINPPKKADDDGCSVGGSSGSGLGLGLALALLALALLRRRA